MAFDNASKGIACSSISFASVSGFPLTHRPLSPQSRNRTRERTGGKGSQISTAYAHNASRTRHSPIVSNDGIQLDPSTSAIAGFTSARDGRYHDQNILHRQRLPPPSPSRSSIQLRPIPLNHGRFVSHHFTIPEPIPSFRLPSTPANTVDVQSSVGQRLDRRSRCAIRSGASQNRATHLSGIRPRYGRETALLPRSPSMVS